MLELLIRTLPGTADKRVAPGDIIAAKLSPAIWGNLELKRCRVVKRNDPQLEARLLAQAARGEPHPVVVDPYAEAEIQQIARQVPDIDPVTKKIKRDGNGKIVFIEKVLPTRVVLVRSAVKVDLAALPRVEGDDDPERVKPIVEAKDVKIDVKTKGEKPVKPAKKAGVKP